MDSSRGHQEVPLQIVEADDADPLDAPHLFDGAGQCQSLVREHLVGEFVALLLKHRGQQGPNLFEAGIATVQFKGIEQGSRRRPP